MCKSRALARGAGQHGRFLARLSIIMMRIPPQFVPVMRRFVAILICLSAGLPLHAGLNWDTQKAELFPKAADPVIETKFGFVNSGQSAVEILKVHSSCGCTIPTLARTVYAPGERGEILVQFTIGERRGVETKNLRVEIKGEPEPTVLTLVVTIPEPARITPIRLVWEVGEAIAAKTISIEALPDQPIRVVNVMPTNPNFTATVATVQENKEYVITVTPKSTETAGMVLLKIETILTERPKVFSAYAQIRTRSSVRVRPR